MGVSICLLLFNTTMYGVQAKSNEMRATCYWKNGCGFNQMIQSEGVMLFLYCCCRRRRCWKLVFRIANRWQKCTTYIFCSDFFERRMFGDFFLFFFFIQHTFCSFYWRKFEFLILVGIAIFRLPFVLRQSTIVLFLFFSLSFSYIHFIFCGLVVCWPCHGHIFVSLQWIWLMIMSEKFVCLFFVSFATLDYVHKEFSCALYF